MGLIFKKIPQIMKAVGSIGKDRANTQQGYKFRGIEDMYSSFHPVMVEAGVFCAPEVLESETSEIEGTNKDGKAKVSYRVVMRVRHRFYTEDGSYVDAVTQGEGIDTSDKASNKAMSAAMKYAFIELFSIPTEDIEESDRESPEAGGRVNPAAPVQGLPKPNTSGKPRPPQSSSLPRPGKPSMAQLSRMWTIMNAHQLEKDRLSAHIKNKFGRESSKDLLIEEYDAVVADIEGGRVPHLEMGARG